VLVGVAIGVVGAHLADRPQPRPVSATPDVRVSLGMGAGQFFVVNGYATLNVPLALLNASSQTETLLSIRVLGPGASLTPGPQAPLQLPIALPPGEFVDVPMAISSDCSVTVRPPPSVALIVVDARHRRYVVPVTIPDMAEMWGQTLLNGSCHTSS
jgi:hypothetical protein